MTSTNHFRNRHLSRGLSAPVSPSPETKRRTSHITLPLTLTATWSWAGLVSGVFNTVAMHTFSLGRDSTLQWSELGFTDLPREYFFFVNWDPSTNTLEAFMQFDLGGGFITFDQILSFGYAGVDPFDSGAVAWQFNTGTVQLVTAGVWVP